MIKKILAIIALSILATTASAIEYTGKVKGLLVNEAGNVSVNIENSSATPNCGGGIWQFNFSMTTPGAKEWFSMLLAARATGTLVTVGYNANPSSTCAVAYLFYLY